MTRFHRPPGRSKTAKTMRDYPAAMSYWYGSAGAERERHSGEAEAFHKEQKKKKKQRARTMKGLRSLLKK